MSLKTVFKILVFVLLVIIAGFLRETLFVRIHWHEMVFTENAYPPEPHWLFSFLKSMDLHQLLVTRYVATMFFIVAFWLLSLLMLKLFFPGQKMKLIHLIFICVFVAGFFLFSLGYILPWKRSLYEIARWDIGLIETPLIIILLFPVLWLKQNEHLLKNKKIQ